MSSDDHPRDRYDEARQRFDELEVEAQVSFLVDATASTLAQGIERIGHAVAEGLEDVVRQAKHRTRPSAETGQQSGAAEPETAQQRAVRNGNSSDS